MTMLVAPRILNAPPGCCGSHLRSSGRPSKIRDVDDGGPAGDRADAARGFANGFQTYQGHVQILVHCKVRLQRMRVVLAIALLAAAASPAYAQSKDPLPTCVVDVRGLFAKLGQDTTTAADLGVAAQQLPGTAIGAAVGVNFYPLKKKKMSLGFGAEGLLARAVAQQAANAQTGAVEGPRIERRFQGISGTVSLNFGHGQGWSYVSAGIGPLRFQTFSGDLPAGAAAIPDDAKLRRRRALVHQRPRRVLLRPAVLSHEAGADDGEYAGRVRQRVMVISAGIAIK